MTDVDDDRMKHTNRARITAYLDRGMLRCGHGSIGLELEHHIVRKTTHAPVSYSERNGIEDILEALCDDYDSRTTSEGHLIGLERSDSNITLEPAGQIEISIAPQCSLESIRFIYAAFREHLDEICDRFGAEVITLGYHPSAKANDLELIPKKRYALMDAHFRHTGSSGACMMRGSASTQISIDYRNESDAIRKFRIACALGPLLAFLCDNSPIFEDEVAKERMARTMIWDDVDPERCTVVEGLMEDDDYSFANYADYLMRSHPILVMEDGNAVSTGKKTTDEVYTDRQLDIDQVEHLLSMFFFDVRLKHYVEIRMADSLPIEYALGYAALIKGVFYSDDSLSAIESMLPQMDAGSVSKAKANLMRNGYMADVYGRLAYEWLDEMIALAWRGLDVTDRHFLNPIASLVTRRSTLFDDAFSPTDEDTPASLAEAWHGCAMALDGDLNGRHEAWQLMQDSSAIYHDEVVRFGFIPALIDRSTLVAFKHIAETTHHILERVIRTYRTDPAYRALFGFEPELEQYILADSGYSQHIPICRIDLFFDPRGQHDSFGLPPFSFCEFNTDGTSAMNEDRAIAHALVATDTYMRMQEHFEMVPQTLFDPWIRSFMSILAEALPDTEDPFVAIVDFPQSATGNEFEEFRKRFEAHGIRCAVCDIRKLVFDGTTLRTHDGQRIDAVYRRAVTSEIMDHRRETSPFIQAVVSGAVISIGAFETQVAHSKKIFEVLLSEATSEFLEPDEVDFISEHVPFTTTLNPDSPLLEEIYSNRRKWIIKPLDGYGSHGVFAGRDCTDDGWHDIVSARLDGHHAISSYCEQYALTNSRVDAPEIKDEGYLPYNQLVGLYIYDGTFAGTYVRAGRNSIIADSHDDITLGSMLVRRRR